MWNKAIDWLVMGLCFGIGFQVSVGVAHFIGHLLQGAG